MRWILQYARVGAITRTRVFVRERLIRRVHETIILCCYDLRHGKTVSVNGAFATISNERRAPERKCRLGTNVYTYSDGPKRCSFPVYNSMGKRARTDITIRVRSIRSRRPFRRIVTITHNFFTTIVPRLMIYITPTISAGRYVFSLRPSPYA